MIERGVSGNELAILDAIRRRGQATRGEIGADIGLGSAMTARLVGQLQTGGWLREAGRIAPTGPGRLSLLLEINPDIVHVGALDIGGDVVHLLVADAAGATRAYRELPSSLLVGKSHAQMIAALAEMVRDIAATTSGHSHQLTALGVTVTGIIDSDRGICLKRSNTAGWENFPIGVGLADALGLPVMLDETARSKSVAERRYGAARDRQHFLYIEAGAAIGAGIVVNGEPMRGIHGLAGELGHVIVDPGGPLCRCGNKGCLQASASANAVVARGRDLLKRGVFSPLSDRSDSLTLTDIAQAAELGDKLALNLLIESGEQLGTAISMALNILGLDFVVMGGQLAQCSPVVVEAAARIMQRRVLPIPPRECTMVRSTLGTQSAAQGVALQALDKIFAGSREWRLPAHARDAHPRQAAHRGAQRYLEKNWPLPRAEATMAMG